MSNDFIALTVLFNSFLSKSINFCPILYCLLSESVSQREREREREPVSV